MWLFVFFDLPVLKAKQRKEYSRFRKYLQNLGFEMFQYSVYTRWCATREQARYYIEKIKNSELPGEGKISVLQVTDKQFSKMENIWISDTKPPEPKQLLLFFE